MRASIPQAKIQKGKTAAHCIQSLLIFVAGCLTLAVLTKDGDNDGRTAYFFALCFVTVPALLYLVAFPMWSRTVRFVNAYVYAVLDIVYTALWFAAFVAVATWNSEGIKQGAKDMDLDENDGNCTTFAHGPEMKCKLSEATVGIGVVICLLFVLTSIISLYYIRKYRETGQIPGVKTGPSGTYNEVLDPTYTGAGAVPGKEDPESAWSANTAELEHEDPLHDAASGANNPYGPDSYNHINTSYAPSVGAYSASNYDTATLTSERKYAPLRVGDLSPLPQHADDEEEDWVDEGRFGPSHPAYREDGMESNAFHISPAVLRSPAASPPPPQSGYEEYRKKNYSFDG